MVFVVLMVTQPDSGSGPPSPAFLAVVVLHVLTMLTSLGLMAVYLRPGGEAFQRRQAALQGGAVRFGSGSRS